MFVKVGDWLKQSMDERLDKLFELMEAQLKQKNAKMTRSQRAIS